MSPVPMSDSNSEQPTRSDSPQSRREVPWRRLIPVVAAVVVAGGLGYSLVGSDSSGDDGASDAPTIRAVTAEQRDLVEYTDLDGTLGYANIASVAVGSDGSITAIVGDGDPLARGDVVYEVNATPTTVFYGDVPLYRPLSEGAEGDDVRLLEANLASLGYHATEDADGEEIDAGFTVDGLFDAATTAAVLRWQADIDVEETGVVAPSDVVVVDGPSTVTNVQVDVGSRVQAGSPILSLNVESEVEAFYGQHSGTVELVGTSGEVSSGQILYVVDDLPVVAIVTDEDFDRTLALGVEDGDDVVVLEQLLADLGYDADGDLEVDDEFDEATAQAIEDWEEDLQDEWEDLIIDGAVSVGEFVTVEPGTRIDTVTQREGDNVALGSELFTSATSSGNRIVTTAIEVAEQDKLLEGAQVEVEFPDGSVVAGVVTAIATSSSKDPTNPEAEAQLAVEISLSEVPDSALNFNELDVEVKLVEDLATGATVVPAAALVATADGGFAVEVVNGNSTSFVAVDPGMFTDGFVEVTGIDPGTAVVVPS